MLWHISDVAGACLLTRDFLWRPLPEVTGASLEDGDGALWAFRSRELAQAFANGYRVCGVSGLVWTRYFLTQCQSPQDA